MEELQIWPLHIRNTKYLIEKFAEYSHNISYWEDFFLRTEYKKVFDNMICTNNEGINLHTRKKLPHDILQGYFWAY